MTIWAFLITYSEGDPNDDFEANPHYLKFMKKYPEQNNYDEEDNFFYIKSHEYSFIYRVILEDKILLWIKI